MGVTEIEQLTQRIERLKHLHGLAVKTGEQLRKKLQHTQTKLAHVESYNQAIIERGREWFEVAGSLEAHLALLHERYELACMALDIGAERYKRLKRSRFN
jgi:hypothetical protein